MAAGRVSGRTATAQTRTAPEKSARNRKIACQPNTVSSTPPISGATIGAITIAVVTRPIMAAARSRA